MSDVLVSGKITGSCCACGSPDLGGAHLLIPTIAGPTDYQFLCRACVRKEEDTRDLTKVIGQLERNPVLASRLWEVLNPALNTVNSCPLSNEDSDAR